MPIYFETEHDDVIMSLEMPEVGSLALIGSQSLSTTSTRITSICNISSTVAVVSCRDSDLIKVPMKPLMPMTESIT